MAKLTIFLLWLCSLVATSEAQTSLLLGAGRGSASAAGAYAPGDYYTGETVQFWYDFSDTTKVLDAGGASASNAETIATVNPSAGTPTATQATDASRPINRTAIANSRQGAEFNGSQLLGLNSASGVIQNTNKVTFAAVFRLDGTASNAQMFGTYDNSYSHRRFLAYLSGDLPALQGERLDSTAHSTVTSGTALATATVHAVIWEWDVAAGTVSIYANNAGTSIAGTAFSTAGTVANTTLNEPRIGNLGDVTYLDAHLATGALMTAGQRTSWFAAVKSRFGITAY